MSTYTVRNKNIIMFDKTCNMTKSSNRGKTWYCLAEMSVNRRKSYWWYSFNLSRSPTIIILMNKKILKKIEHFSMISLLEWNNKISSMEWEQLGTLADHNRLRPMFPKERKYLLAECLIWMVENHRHSKYHWKIDLIFVHLVLRRKMRSNNWESW